MEEQATGKFLFLENIYRFFQSMGLGSGVADALTFVIACCFLLLLIWILRILGSLIISLMVKAVLKHSDSKWPYFLHKRNFYKRVINFFAAILIYATSKTIFEGFGEGIIGFARTILDIYIIAIGLQVFNSFMNTVNDVYETKPQAKRKSIRSIIQSVQIVAAVLAVIFVISTVVGRSPTDLLIALGAFAAIITLIFRDTILGFVASIQISAQEMIRPGDWIEMPSRGADGMVQEINITNVKVKNWDNSVSMIPTYAMISESFTNWRNMQESKGRRFKRPILVDINSIGILSGEQVDNIMSDPLIDKKVAEGALKLLKEGNTSNFTTNLGLYRCYIEAYLHNHPKIAQNQLRVVRYLDNTENGVTIQLYAFSTDKALLGYEHIISDIFENIMVVLPLFRLRLYQRPASK